MKNVFVEVFNNQTFNQDGDESVIIRKKYYKKFCEIVKTGGRVFDIYQGVICRKNFKISPFRRVSEEMFALRQKYKDQDNGLMQRLV